MRAICAVAVALVVSLGGTLAAGQLDVSPQDTELSEALWRIAVATHTRIGFQSVDRTRHFGRNKSANPEALDVSDALDGVVTADPRYEWHWVGKTAVIRPREAWIDPADPLNRRVPSAQLMNETTNGVLAGLSNLIFYNQFTLAEPNHLGLPVSYHMKAGTVVDALNQLTEESGQVMWVAYARPRDNPNGWNVCTNIGSCHSALEFELRDTEHDNGGLATQPQRGKPTAIKVPK